LTSAELLADAFSRVTDVVHEAVEGLDADRLNFRIAGRTNSIAWLVWHLTRVQDDHVADVAGTEQEWTAGGWVSRFDLSLPRMSTGYGHNDADVDAVKVDGPELLLGYYDAVAATTRRYVEGLVDVDLDRVVDERWDPPVTLGVRLISVIGDDLQHAGQAAYLRGALQSGVFSG